MIKIVSILCFILYCKSLNESPSYRIWNEVKNSIANGEIIYDKNHFIFDEANITGLDIHSQKMQALFQKQKEIYDANDKFANFIFIIQNIDEQFYSLEQVAKELSKYLDQECNKCMSNSILALLSMNTRAIWLKIGSMTESKIDDSELDSMIENLAENMKSLEYY